MTMTTSNNGNGIIAFDSEKRWNTLLLGYYPLDEEAVAGGNRFAWGLAEKRAYGETRVGLVDKVGPPAIYIAPERRANKPTMQTGFVYDYIHSVVYSFALSRPRYTGKERDAESGLDYFGARYYGSSMGRFLSPDPSGLVFADRQIPRASTCTVMF